MPTKNTVPTRILTRPRRPAPHPSSALFGTLADQGRLRTVDYAAVTPNPNQPRKRFEQDALERLAESIRARGLLQPLIVRETELGSFQIIAGERRWRALGIIEAETVDVLVSETQDDATALQDDLIENVVREDLSPIEKGRGYASLI
ncbi:MAG: ParB/RepB/Spo0J family partition protein, partial [Solirubrobacteraceae bacterium]